MSQPKRIQRKRTKGWRLPHGATCVTGRAWSNPFATGKEFRFWMEEIDEAGAPSEPGTPKMHRMIWIYKNLHLLRGFDLAGDERIDEESHVDTLLEYANR